VSGVLPFLLSPSSYPHTSLGPRGSRPCRALPTSPPLAGTGSRGGHLPGPPACPPSRLLLAPTEPPNRPLATLRPFPRRPRPDLPRPSPEFPAGPPPDAPRGYIAKNLLFSRASLQKVNSNSRSDFLILVNCVDHIKIGKIRNQFCWIHGELSYNFSC
jgi:hypothetical protein